MPGISNREPHEPEEKRMHRIMKRRFELAKVSIVFGGKKVCDSKIAGEELFPARGAKEKQRGGEPDRRNGRSIAKKGGKITGLQNERLLIDSDLRVTARWNASFLLLDSC